MYDALPKDSTRAYINYYPTQNTMGTLALEDNWPFLGDYDFNDLIVNYRYTVISDASNRAFDIEADYVLKAGGASFVNGFGVQLPFAAALVKATTGSLVTTNTLVILSAKGTEDVQTTAVIIPFDNAFTAMNTTGGFNTYIGSPFLTKDTIKMGLAFTRPLLQTELGIAPFNPFIIINKTRGREAHLAGYLPTDKADPKYFKTGVDNTLLAQNKYYKTTSNFPWALAFASDFKYPAELKAINSSYGKFITWAQSAGINSSNWYIDSTNIVNNFIYHR